MSDRFLRMPEVEARVGMKRSTIYRRIANEKFPKPVKLGVNIVAWPESAVNAWMDGVMSGSVTEPAKGE